MEPIEDRVCTPGCRGCLAGNVVGKLAWTYEELGDTATADALYKVFDDAAGRTPFGQKLQAILLGEAP